MFSQIYFFKKFMDPVLLSNFLMIPSIIKSYIYEQYVTCAIAACSVTSSFLYHSANEQKYHNYDLFFARLVVLWFFTWYYKESTKLCQIFLGLSLYCFLKARGRHETCDRSPKYIFWHSLFHVCISLASFFSF